MVPINECLDTSVVIPSFNRHGLLIEVLPSYLRQKYVKEIIVVDDGSEPPLQERLTSHGMNDPRVHILRHSRNMGSCAARNTGIMAARSKWILFGEDDLVLSDDHVENLHKERIRLGSDLICGNLIQQEIGESFRDSLSRISARTHVPVFNNQLITVNYGAILTSMELPFCHAIFMAPTEILRKYLFSTRIGGPSFMREDLEVQLTLRERGYRLFATPTAMAYHYAKSKSHGSGTRLNLSVIAFTASAAVNTWQVIEQHYETIAPFFDNISKKSMIFRAVFWTTFIEIKRRMQVAYPLFDLVIRSLRWFRLRR